MESIFDVIENYIGVALKPNTLKVFKKLSDKEALELHELIQHCYQKNYWFVDSGKPHERLSNDVRYAVLTDKSGHTDSWEIWHNDDYLKKLLLYYPKLSVLDPIDDYLPSLLDLPQINRLDEPIALLLPIRNLIKNDIIRLVPGSTARHTVLKQIDIHPIIQNIFTDNSIFEAFKIYDPEHYDFIVNCNLKMPGFTLSEAEKEVINSLVRTDVPHSLLTWSASIVKYFYATFTISDLTDSNIAFITKKEARFFTKLLGSEPEVLKFLGRKDDYVTFFILSLSLPNIKNISWEDINLIRENDEDFYYWREAFRNVLKDSYQYEKFSDKLFFDNAKEILSSRSRILREAIQQKSSLKNKFTEAWIPAGIGFASGALIGAIEAAMTSAVITGSLSLLYSLFTKRAKKSEEALYKHFSIFLEE